MKILSIIVILFLILSITGCTSTDTPEVTPVKTAVPTEIPATPTATPTKPPVTPSWSYTPTPTATTDEYDGEYPDDEYYEEPEEILPTESNVSAIMFSEYTGYSSNDTTTLTDFTIDYPSTWTTLFRTVPNIDNRINAIDNLKKEMRISTLTSEDGNVSVSAYVSDFITPGKWILDTNIEHYRGNVARAFTDVNGATALTNYNHRYNTEKNDYLTFDVIIPQSSRFYPYAYSELRIVSRHHYYTFQFATENGVDDLTTYRDLKRKIFSSIKVEPMTPSGGGEMIYAMVTS